MSINMIQRNCSDCKYVEIFTHRVGSVGAPSRKTVFIKKTNTKQYEDDNNNSWQEKGQGVFRRYEGG
jgi:hypothetical protein